jgi:hypothetical protein
VRLKSLARGALGRLAPPFSPNWAAQIEKTGDGENGGAKRDRTADLLHAMQALSQLSYGPNFLAPVPGQAARKPNL